MPEETLSRREAGRLAASGRREARAALRKWSFEALAGGWSVEEIAEMRKVSPRTIRREIAAVTAARQVEAPEAYIHAQLARLNKALRVADGALDRGNLKAVGPMVRLVAALDRYHGLAARPAPRPDATVETLPPPMRALPRAAPADFAYAPEDETSREARAIITE